MMAIIVIVGRIKIIIIMVKSRPLSYSGDEAVSRLREAIMSGSSVPMLEAVLSATQVIIMLMITINTIVINIIMIIIMIIIKTITIPS